MSGQHSLQRRLALSLGVLLAALWVAAAAVTAVLVRHSMDQVFDSALQETAQRILPLAVADILGRDEKAVTQRLAAIREHDELLAYAVRDREGNILLLSHDADSSIFQPWQGVGFSESDRHRFYNEEALQGSVRLTVAEPLAHRDAISWEVQMSLGLPVLVFLPVALLAIAFAVRGSLTPLHRFRERLSARSPRDLSFLAVDDLPTELRPLAQTLNGLLGRLASAFEAERSFTANAAHELRTPLAGAIAQAQRLQAETTDPGAMARAADIETTLKRLSRLSERLMQLARAEGGRLRMQHVADLRPVARLLSADMSQMVRSHRISLVVPDTPLMSDLDPDIFAILYRNLVDNAIRHGGAAGRIDVALTPDGLLTVANDGPVVPPETLSRLTKRFERAGNDHEGSGLGLAIVSAIAQRTGTELELKSPRPGAGSGFEASLRLPVTKLSPTPAQDRT